MARLWVVRAMVVFSNFALRSCWSPCLMLFSYDQDLHGGEPKKSSVDRRYKDFLWLREQLRQSIRGIVIPPLPEATFMGKEIFHNLCGWEGVGRGRIVCHLS
jgi:hypothetical protein